MPRDRPVDMSPQFLPIVQEEQLVPGTLADAVHRLVDTLDLSAFDSLYRNDTHGASVIRKLGASHPAPASRWCSWAKNLRSPHFI